jgi:peroxiredoxin
MTEEPTTLKKQRNPFLIIGGFALLGIGLALVLFGSPLFNDNKSTSEPTANISNSSGNNGGVDAFTLPTSSLKAGDKAPDFTLSDLDGNEVTLSDFQGQPVIVNFWATWCPPCRIEMPDLQQTFVDNQASDLVILAVNKEEPADVVRAFFYDEMGLTFTPVLDTNSAVGNEYGAFNLPTSFFVDADGVITAVHRGFMTFGQIEGYLDATLPN